MVKKYEDIADVTIFWDDVWGEELKKFLSFLLDLEEEATPIET